MELLPRVKSRVVCGGHFIPRRSISVYTDAVHAHLVGLCAKEYEAQLPITLNVETGRMPARTSGAIMAAVNPKLAGLSGKGKEAYRIDIAGNIAITGTGREGLFYGFQTLLQILRQSSSRLAGCVIEDYPDYRVRMVMYDFGRANHIRMDHLKFVIDRLAEHKVNAFMPYLENHFVFKKHPNASAYGSMTPQEAKELDDYCAERFIEVVPQFNAYGHNEDMLSDWRNRHLADDKYNPYQLCASNPEAVRVARDIITEMSSAFRTKFFHAGGDETGAPVNCPRCAPLHKKVGVTGLYSMHYRRIYEHVKKLGKRMMIWGDIALHHRGIADKLPKDIVIFDWHYEGSSPDTVKFFKDKGFCVYVCPSDWSWYATFTAFSIPAENILRFVPDGYRNGADGACMTVWEMHQAHYFHNTWFGVILSAEAMWNASRIPAYSRELVAEYERAFAKLFFGTGDRGYTEVLELLQFGAQEIFPAFTSTPPTLRRDILHDYNPYIIRHLYGEEFTEAHYRKLKALFNKALAVCRRFRKTVKLNAVAASMLDYPAMFGNAMIERIRLLNETSRLYREMYRKQDKVPAGELVRKIGVCVRNLRTLQESAAKLTKVYEFANENFGSPPEDMWTMNTHKRVFETYAGYMEYHWKNFRKGVKLVPPAEMKL